jgi:hypothetical protein
LSVRLPGSLKALSEQLAAFPATVTRVTVPTKNGPFVLEFGQAKEAHAAAPARREEEKADGRLPQNPKVRDTRLLSRQPPTWRFDDQKPEAA